MKFIFLFLCWSLVQICFGQEDQQSLNKIISDYERPYLDTLIAADYLDLEMFGKLNRRKKKNVKKIKKEILSRKYSNPMESAMAALLLVDNRYALNTFFELFPFMHAHSASLRPYELMNYPVVSTLFEFQDDQKIIYNYYKNNAFWKDCKRFVGYSELMRLFLRTHITEMNIVQAELPTTGCAGNNVKTIWKLSE